jgi:hypothetical protein
MRKRKELEAQHRNRTRGFVTGIRWNPPDDEQLVVKRWNDKLVLKTGIFTYGVIHASLDSGRNELSPRQRL